MKTDRLLAIVIYLLNHDIVSAATLAQRFEVSKRTILRDIDHIALAGIPIKSITGARGGYSIMEGYKLDGRLINESERSAIITALEGFRSAYDSQKYNNVLDKISSVLPNNQQQHVFLDFGASGENCELQEKLKLIETAISDKCSLRISYVNAQGEASIRIIEPLALNYRWYAWYLLAFCTIKQDYRIFKVTRIGELDHTDTAFSKKHGNPADILKQAFQVGKRKEISISLLCKSTVKTQVCEYLDGDITEILANGDFIMNIYAMEDERMWFAMLLSFGNLIQVIEPDGLKARLVEIAKNILSIYKE